MIDCETLGVGASPVILTVAAVTTGDIEPFSRAISLQDSISRGLTVTASTVRWWLQQSDAARSRLIALLDHAQPLEHVLHALTGWFDQVRAGDPVRDSAVGSRQIRVWSYGSAADLVWLRSAFDLIRVRCPWTYREEYCLRTLVNTYYQIGGDQLQRSGDTAHVALDGARYQMKVLSTVQSRLGVPHGF